MTRKDTDESWGVYTVEQAAGILHCSTKTIRRRITASSLGCYRDGGMIRVGQQHIEAYLASVEDPARGVVRVDPRAHPRSDAGLTRQPVKGGVVVPIRDRGCPPDPGRDQPVRGSGQVRQPR